MLASNKMKLVEELFTTFTKEELFWLNGYIAGKFKSEPEISVAATPKAAINKLTITYGTETGNSKRLASEFAAKAKKSGLNAKLVSLDQYRLNDLPKEEYLLSIVSTQGEGEPPAAAKKFYEHIHNNGFKLDRLKYSVLALGDTSYPLFCKAGEDIDEQLNRLGGERIAPLQKCDVDYEHDADSWFQQVLSNLSTPTNADAQVKPLTSKKPAGKQLYRGTILTNINLNDQGSNKQTHHIEIAAENVDYLPGDALGVVPENPQTVVNHIIDLLGANKAATYNYRDQELTLEEILKKKLNIIYLPERVVAKYAQLIKQEIPATKIGLLDLLRIYPLTDATRLEQLIEVLEPIVPRLYSIASSPEAHPGEIHLTVAKDSFTLNAEQKCGLCSDYLTSLPAETSFEFYIHKNSQFRLPENDKDVIMIGPGTGIAPFRSFIAHRDTTGATGRNWLFFGDQHFVTDFLYQTELQNWMDTGVLTQLNVAFSRDQQEKVYVQHKMWKHGEQLYSWLKNGASVYVCGAKDPMSTDVESALQQIVEKFGGKSTEEAAQYLQQLKEEGRYLKDVY